MPANQSIWVIPLLILLQATRLGAQEPSEESQETELASHCETAHYIVLGTISKNEFAGETGPPEAETRHWFYRMQVAHESDLLGELRERNRVARESVDLDPVDEFVIHALLTRTAPLPGEFTEGTRCIVWLHHMRASATAGTIPVTMLEIRPADDGLLQRVRELVADRADQE